LIDSSPRREDRGEESAGAEFGDRQRDVAHLGGEHAWPAAVAVAAAFLAALMAFGTKHSGDLQLDQLCCRPWRVSSGISSPVVLPSSSYARAEAPESALGMVRLVEVVLEPGKRACPAHATTGVSGVHAHPGYAGYETSASSTTRRDSGEKRKLWEKGIRVCRT
jgi:hypothetical protein